MNYKKIIAFSLSSPTTTKHGLVTSLVRYSPASGKSPAIPLLDLSGPNSPQDPFPSRRHSDPLKETPPSPPTPERRHSVSYNPQSYTFFSQTLDTVDEEDEKNPDQQFPCQTSRRPSVDQDGAAELASEFTRAPRQRGRRYSCVGKTISPKSFPFGLLHIEKIAAQHSLLALKTDRDPTEPPIASLQKINRSELIHIKTLLDQDDTETHLRACIRIKELRSFIVRAYFQDIITPQLQKQFPGLVENSVVLFFHRILYSGNHFGASWGSDADWNMVITDKFAKQKEALSAIFTEHQATLKEQFNIDLEIEDFTIRTLAEIHQITNPASSEYTQKAALFYTSIRNHHDLISPLPDGKTTEPQQTLKTKIFEFCPSDTEASTFQLFTDGSSLLKETEIGWEIDLKQAIRYLDFKIRIKHSDTLLETEDHHYLSQLALLQILQNLVYDQNPAEYTVLTSAQFTQFMQDDKKRALIQDLLFNYGLCRVEGKTANLISIPAELTRLLVEEKYSALGYSVMKNIEDTLLSLSEQLETSFRESPSATPPPETEDL